MCGRLLQMDALLMIEREKDFYGANAMTKKTDKTRQMTVVRRADTN